jgi:hypothetical protein
VQIVEKVFWEILVMRWRSRLDQQNKIDAGVTSEPTSLGHGECADIGRIISYYDQSGATAEILHFRTTPECPLTTQS